MDIEKNEEVSEISVESPAEGVDESFSDVPAEAVTEEAERQEAASQGGLAEQQREDSPEDPEAMGGDAPEGEQPSVSEDVVEEPQVVVANEVQEDGSFWSGFFGAPKIPRVK